MTTYAKHTWPGLSKPVYLPDWIPVEVKIIPASVAGWSAGIKSDRHTTFTQHFTGNMNSSAASEWNWANGGGRAAIGSNGSYQLIVDGNRVIVAQRFDEMAGHAANNTGNFTSYASEMAIAGGYEKAFQNAARVAAGVIVSKGWQVDTALLQHWNWLRSDGTQKNCPSIIRDKRDWSRFVATVGQFATEIRDHIRGQAPVSPGPAPSPVPVPAAPTYAKPETIPELALIAKAAAVPPATVVASGTRWYAVFDRVRTVKPTGRFQRASRDAARLGPDLKIGEEFDVDFITEYGGELWYYTPWGTRVAVSDVERISDAKGVAA